MSEKQKINIRGVFNDLSQLNYQLEKFSDESNEYSLIKLTKEKISDNKKHFFKIVIKNKVDETIGVPIPDFHINKKRKELDYLENFIINYFDSMKHKYLLNKDGNVYIYTEEKKIIDILSNFQNSTKITELEN